MHVAKAGDDIAYRKLLDMLAPRIRAMARHGLARCGRGSEDAEEIVQEALLTIHLKRHTWDEGRPLEPWVQAIAHHKLVDHLRRQGFTRHLNIDDYAEQLACPGSDSETALSDCVDLMGCLNGRQRRIVVGVSIEGRSAREVGTALGMSEGAVRIALHRALKALAAAYRRGVA